MKVFLAAMWAAIAICFILAISQQASAHTSYKGHTVIYWTVTSPTSGATIRYRERLVDQWGCSNHGHEYLTEQYKCGSYGCVWADIHGHIRILACHAT